MTGGDFIKTKFTLQGAAAILFGIATVLFVAFFFYIGFSENVSIDSARHSHSYTYVQNYTVESVANPDTPIGQQTVYRWTLDDIPNSESCLCFYLVHHYAEVYIDNEVIYTLTARDSNRIGNSISSNWVTVPVHNSDNGKEIILVLTPLFESMIDYEPEFLLGSHFSIAYDQLKQDLPQLFISLLCIILGAIIISVQLYFIFCAQTKNLDMIYLGGISMILGIWRITDMKSSPILFPSNPMVLGYITIGSLFLCGVIMMLYASTLFSRKKATPFLLLASIASLIIMGVLGAQILGFADFKEMLTISHILLIIAICIVPIMSIHSRRTSDMAHISGNGIFFLFLTAGVSLDILTFYISDSSSHVMYTIICFLIYTVLVFVSNILETTRKAYIDDQTGLINRSRWNELLHNHTSNGDSTGLIMMDLNSLKAINDSYGHETGDQQILNFSKLLLNTFPSSCHICRWGGDEFSVMTIDIPQDKLAGYIDTLAESVNEFNASSGTLKLSYALGWVYSSEFPDMNVKELMRIADERMYQNKKEKKSMI